MVQLKVELHMWNSASTLQAISQFLLWVVAAAGSIAAVAGLISSLFANRASDLVQAGADRRIAAAQTVADAAKDQVAFAKRDAALANERAAEANARAAEANLALEKYKAPRTIPPEARAEIVAALKPFAGQQYSFSVGFGDEPLKLMLEVDHILEEAGWQRVESVGAVRATTPIGLIPVNTLSGVSVRIAPDSAPKLGNQVATLAAVLDRNGIAASPARNPDLATRPDIIDIMVGSKN